MKLGSIAGVTLPVRDVATSAAFYAAIGFRPGRASANSAVVYVNWFWVELVSGEPDPGTAAIGVKVDSVEAARDELIELGLSDSLVGAIRITAAGRRHPDRRWPARVPAGRSRRLPAGVLREGLVARHRTPTGRR